MRFKRHRGGLFAIFGLTAVIAFAIAGSDLYRDASENWKLASEVYRRILSQHADPIDPKELAEASIRGMLSVLDPYSAFLEEEDQAQLDLVTKGRYGGIGLELGIRDDTLMVIAPMDGTPAFRSGIYSGDRIIAIDGASTRGMGVDDAAKRIRGDKGTVVTLLILRFGESQPLMFELTRETILVQDVPYWGMVDEEVGYVRLNRFSNNAPEEVRQAFTGLKEQGAGKVILDLRGNPGGVLDPAVKILSLVVPKGTRLLATRGRNPEIGKEYFAESEPILGPDVRLAVLIDQGSASASEIVAGSIQDLDRGIIIGTPSFGKGLVQSVYAVAEGKSVKLTTAKYFIPSGRLIQKPGYLRGLAVPLADSTDSSFATQRGRRLTAHGGIVPDVAVSQEKAPPLTRECYRRGLFFKFALMHRQQEGDGASAAEPDLEDFAEFLRGKTVELDLHGGGEYRKMRAALDSSAVEEGSVRRAMEVLESYYDSIAVRQLERERIQVEIALERELASLAGGHAERIRSSFDDDPVILKAVELLVDRAAYAALLAPAEQ